MGFSLSGELEFSQGRRTPFFDVACRIVVYSSVDPCVVRCINSRESSGTNIYSHSCVGSDGREAEEGQQ